MRSTSLVHASANCEYIDDWPLIHARAWFHGHSSYVSADENSSGAYEQGFSKAGDAVSLEIMGNGDWNPEIRKLSSLQLQITQHPF